MKTVRQDYEKIFKCIADKCPCTCCSGWQIVADEASLQKYEDYRGNIPEKVASSIDFDEGTICQKKDGSCAFLNEKGLCDWILADGEDILCDTCRLYPRHVEEYEDLREWSLSLSCPEAARMFIERESRAKLEEIVDDEQDPLEDEYDDFDIFLFEQLICAREVMFKLTEKENLSTGYKATFLVEFSKELQDCLDNDEVFMMAEVSKKYTDILDNIKYYKEAKTGVMDITDTAIGNLELFDNLERLDEGFDEYVNLCINYKAENGRENKKDTSLNADVENLIEGYTDNRFDMINDNLFFYFIYTYFLGAVYNGMIYAYTMMCVFGVSAINAIARGMAKGEKITAEEFERIVYSYSRETEHSDININTILEYFDEKYPKKV